MARRKTGPRAWIRESHRTKDKKVPKGKRRWEVVYEDPSHEFKRRTKGGFASVGAAEQWRDGDECPYNNPKWVDPARGDVTFQSVAEAWLKTYVSESGKARGKAQHAGLINGEKSLVRSQWGERRIGDITHGEVAAWIADVSARRKPTTVRHNFYTFRLVIRYALADGLLLRDPTVGVKMPKQGALAGQQAKRYALSAEQVQAVIAATPHPWTMYTRLAAATGMRPEELTGLQLRDLTSDASALTVRRVWVKDELSRSWLYEDAGKTPAASRTIPLDDFTAQHLRDYLVRHAQRAELFFKAEPDRRPTDPTTLPLFPGVGEFRRGQRQRQNQPDLDAWTFTDANGEPSPLKHGWFTRRYWSGIRTATGLPTTVRFYDLRHFFGSWHAARLGQPSALTLAELSERMGHASTHMTLDRYVHVQPEVDKRNAGAGMWATDATNVVALRPA